VGGRREERKKQGKKKEIWPRVSTEAKVDSFGRTSKQTSNSSSSGGGNCGSPAEGKKEGRGVKVEKGERKFRGKKNLNPLVLQVLANSRDGWKQNAPKEAQVKPKGENLRKREKKRRGFKDRAYPFEWGQVGWNVRLPRIS